MQVLKYVGTQDVMNITGCSRRQMDYWSRLGGLGRSYGHGVRRLYTIYDVDVAQVLTKLSHSGNGNGDILRYIPTLLETAQRLDTATITSKDRNGIYVIDPVRGICLGYRTSERFSSDLVAATWPVDILVLVIVVDLPWSIRRVDSGCTGLVVPDQPETVVS